MSDFLVFPGALEIRQDDLGTVLAGAFPFNVQATISNRGGVRKEVIQPGAFDFAIDEGREINLLSGHDFAKPLATTRNASLALESTEEALQFSARLPTEMPSYMRDTVDMIRAGLAGGISPGFTVAGVPDATEIVPEPGNPGVSIRVVRAALLYELSIVTRPAYPDTELTARARPSKAAPAPIPVHRWLV